MATPSKVCFPLVHIFFEFMLMSRNKNMLGRLYIYIYIYIYFDVFFLFLYSYFRVLLLWNFGFGDISLLNFIYSVKFLLVFS